MPKWVNRLFQTPLENVDSFMYILDNLSLCAEMISLMMGFYSDDPLV